MSTYMTLEEYTATLKVGDEVTIKYYSITGEKEIMVYYATVSGYIQEVRFDTDSTLHQLLRKAGKLYRSEEGAKRYLDKDYKDLIIQEEE